MPEDVLRLRRIEVIDSGGNLRAVIGAVADEFGLILYDSQGAERALATTGPHGAAMTFVAGGNEVLRLGVLDDDAENYVGVELLMTDGAAVPRLRAMVDSNGTVLLEQTEHRGNGSTCGGSEGGAVAASVAVMEEIV